MAAITEAKAAASSSGLQLRAFTRAEGGPAPTRATRGRHQGLRVGTYNCGAAGWTDLTRDEAWGGLVDSLVRLARRLDIIFLTEIGTMGRQKGADLLLTTLGQKSSWRPLTCPTGFTLRGGYGPAAQRPTAQSPTRMRTEYMFPRHRLFSRRR